MILEQRESMEAWAPGRVGGDRVFLLNVVFLVHRMTFPNGLVLCTVTSTRQHHVGFCS